MPRRSFTRRGVALIDAPGPDPVALVPVRARRVRDGEVLPVPLAIGAPPSWRLVGNAVALFGLVLFLGLGLLAIGPVAVGYRPVVVGSGSMEPSLRVADVVVVQDPTQASVGVGTVIDIETAQGNKIHRVVEVVPDGFRTKGDANATVDPDLVAADDVSGVGVFLVPFVGLPRVWFDEGEWVKLALLASAFVAAAWCSRAEWLRRTNRAEGPIVIDREAHAV